MLSLVLVSQVLCVYCDSSCFSKSCTICVDKAIQLLGDFRVAMMTILGHLWNIP